MHFGDYPVISGVGPAGFTFLSATLSILASVLMLATAKLAATSLPLKMVSPHFALKYDQLTSRDDWSMIPFAPLTEVEVGKLLQLLAGVQCNARMFCFAGD